MASPQSRKAYSISEKLALVDRVRSGETQAKISKKLGTARLA